MHTILLALSCSVRAGRGNLQTGARRPEMWRRRIMDELKFTITEEGQVYPLGEHGRQVLLGHISCLAREETPLGREVRAWWQSRLASDEPVETIVALDRNEPCFVRTSED